MDAEPLAAMDGAELVDWRTLPPARRQEWWHALWSGTLALVARYRLALRAGWWQDAVQVEALAAFCCWLRLYDSGAETDPTGKLQLLWELERLRGVLRAGEQPFDAQRDRAAFEQYLTSMTRGRASDAGAAPGRGDAALACELAALGDRLSELRARERTLNGELTGPDRQFSGRDGRAARGELGELRRTIRQLTERQRETADRVERSESEP